MLAGMRDPSTGLWSLIAASVSSGESRELVDPSPHPSEVLMWAPDSASVFIRRPGSGDARQVLRVFPSGGRSVQVDWPLGSDTRDFRVHPDGRQIVFVQNTAAETAQSELLVIKGIAR